MLFGSVVFGGIGFLAGLTVAKVAPEIAKKILDKVQKILETAWKYAETETPSW